VEKSDAELVRRCRDGDDDAWRELVERFARYVYAIANSFRLSEPDVEDAFQDTFAKAYERLHTLRDDDALRPWLASLTRRLCIDRLRASRREELLEDAELEPAPETMELLDEAFAVHEALAELPEHCREILDRFFARDESYRTIADELGLPAGTIASRISRCLVRMKSLLGEEIVGEARLEDR
jgi:RNA polymerase sigma factor (sigma-70 family)